ncbi:MAG: hypothetical protein WCK46_03375 [Candidatus Adlerbacteria bacterium]
MTEVVHADIFFFIASAATVCVTALVLVALYYVVRIVRDVNKITTRLTKATAELEQDFEELRSQIKTEGVKVRAMADLVLGFVLSRLKRRTQPRKQKPQAEETLQ